MTENKIILYKRGTERNTSSRLPRRMFVRLKLTSGEHIIRTMSERRPRATAFMAMTAFPAPVGVGKAFLLRGKIRFDNRPRKRPKQESSVIRE